MMRKDEKGVSPVIGVILMVAVTVILATIVWNFVSTYASSPQVMKAPIAALQAVGVNEGGTGKIKITHVGGEPIKCAELSITSDGDSWENLSTQDACTDDGYFSVGETLTNSTSTSVTSGIHTVTVIHTPTNTVLLQTTVRVP
jgi:flagellin-like protein